MCFTESDEASAFVTIIGSDVAVLPPGFCAYQLLSGADNGGNVQLQQPRGIVAMGTRSVLVLERGTGSIVQLLDTTGDGIPNHKVTLTTFPGLNHGLARSREYIYASTANEVYRWRYYHQSGDTTNTTDSSQHLLSDLLVLVNVPELGLIWIVKDDPFWGMSPARYD